MPAKFRLRPTVLQLIRQGDLPQIKELCAKEHPSLQLLDVFIREASRLQQTEILVYFMNQKQGMDLARPAVHLTRPDLCLQIWNLTREQLSVKYPFLRSFLWYFTFRTSTETTTAGTDGSVIYFSHDFLLHTFRETPHQLEHFLLHTVGHCLLLHTIQEQTEDSATRKKNSDSAVEAFFKEPYPAPFWDDHHFWNTAVNQDFLSRIALTLSSLTGVSGTGSYGNGSKGNSSGELSEELAIRNTGTYDFTHFLKQFARQGEEIKTDIESFDYIPYLYGLEHYGNIPLIEHLEYQEVNRLEELVIAIDTSGSCSLDIVRKFMEETYSILSNHENFFRKMNVYVIQCDSFIQDMAHITSEQDWQDYLKNLTIHGRGGTDFRPVFEYVEELRAKKELKDLKGLLYFTDGDGIYPEIPTDYKTAFVFYKEKEQHQKVPAWAACLTLDTERSNEK